MLRTARGLHNATSVRACSAIPYEDIRQYSCASRPRRCLSVVFYMPPRQQHARGNTVRLSSLGPATCIRAAKPAAPVQYMNRRHVITAHVNHQVVGRTAKIQQVFRVHQRLPAGRTTILSLQFFTVVASDRTIWRRLAAKRRSAQHVASTAGARRRPPGAAAVCRQRQPRFAASARR